MSPDEINKIINEAFNQSFKEWERQIEDELYPSAFADPYSWLRVKNALLVNNACLKKALKLSLSKILKD